MARLRVEVHWGDVKHAYVRDGVDEGLFRSDRADEMRKEIASMAETLSEWWERFGQDAHGTLMGRHG